MDTPDRQLRYFLRIAELKSLSRAAEDLDQTQSGLSRQLAALEAHVGKPLFVRTGRGVELTEAGARLLDGIQPAYQSIDRVLEAVRQREGVTQGTVRLATAHTLSYYFMAERQTEDAMKTIDYYFWMNSDWAYLGAYRVAELARWCRKLGIHVNPQPAHMCPDAGLASRIVIAADQAGLPVAALYKAILKAEWCDEQDISDAATLRAILLRQGLDAPALLAAAAGPEAQEAYRRNTDAAVEAGVFGSPAYVYRGEVFWGQDRLDMLEEAVAG